MSRFELFTVQPPLIITHPHPLPLSVHPVSVHSLSQHLFPFCYFWCFKSDLDAVKNKVGLLNGLIRTSYCVPYTPQCSSPSHYVPSPLSVCSPFQLSQVLKPDFYVIKSKDGLQYSYNIQSIFKHYLDNMWAIFGQYLGNIWTICGPYSFYIWTIS